MRYTQILTNRQRQLLGEFLELAEDKEEALTLRELEGFLFGLAITPDMIMPSEWIPVIFGDEIPEFENLQQLQLLIKNLLDAYNAYLEAAHKRKLHFPFGDLQIVEELSLEDIYEIRDWASGFLLALGLHPEIWHLDYEEEYEAPSQDIQKLLWSFAIVYGVVYPEVIYELFETPEGRSAGEDLDILQLFPLLPIAVQNFIDYGFDMWQRKVEDIKKGVADFKAKKVKIGRNDPCPCGSGKKYKKCCGKN